MSEKEPPGNCEKETFIEVPRFPPLCAQWVSKRCVNFKGWVPGGIRSRSRRADARRGVTQAGSLRPTSQREVGGGRGIRTPGTLPGTAVFKTAAIDHSAIPPRRTMAGHERDVTARGPQPFQCNRLCHRRVVWRRPAG